MTFTAMSAVFTAGKFLERTVSRRGIILFLSLPFVIENDNQSNYTTPPLPWASEMWNPTSIARGFLLPGDSPFHLDLDFIHVLL
jgi:hypothetical protein